MSADNLLHGLLDTIILVVFPDYTKSVYHNHNSSRCSYQRIDEYVTLRLLGRVRYLYWLEYIPLTY